MLVCRVSPRDHAFAAVRMTSITSLGLDGIGTWLLSTSFLVGVPAFEAGSNFVDQYWFAAHVETAGLVPVMTVPAPPSSRRKAGAPRKTPRRRFSRMCLDTEARRASNVAVHDRP